MVVTHYLVFAAAIVVPASLAAQGTSPVADEIVTPFADIPNVTLVTYDVSGRTPAALRTSIDAARPTDPNDAKRVDGLSRYEFRWRAHGSERSKCTAAPEDVSFSATVTVPRLNDDGAPAALRDRFDRYRQSLLLHEDGHIRYAWDHRGDIVAALNAESCAAAKKAVQEALNAIVAHDIAYDKATQHGATSVVPF